VIERNPDAVAGLTGAVADGRWDEVERLLGAMFEVLDDAGVERPARWSEAPAGAP
jgi:hypothetical protein